MVLATEVAVSRLLAAGLICLCLSWTRAHANSEGAQKTEAAQDTLARMPPRTVMLRSAILPGWGQYTNDRPVKALLFAAAAATSLSSAMAEVGALDRAVTPEEHQDRAARRNTRFLLLAVTATLAAVDAYVDAHLADLDAVDLELVLVPDLHPGTELGTMTAMVRVRIR